MAAPSIITETDNMSTTLTDSSWTESPLSVSQGSTHTSVTNSPLLENHPPQRHHHHQQGIQPNNDEEASGWPRIAKLMVDKPAFESYSRFRELNVKTLLYYQVELSLLRDDLTKLENKDRDKRGLNAGMFAKRADYLVSSDILPNPKDREQWKLVLKIRRLLKHYNAAVLQHVQMSALPDADSSNVEELRKWMKRPEFGNYCIEGKGSDAWGKLGDPVKLPNPLMRRVLQLLRSIFWPQKVRPKKLDLVSTLPHRDMDGLTRWVLYEWIPFYQAWKNPPPPGNPNDPEKHLDQSPKKNNKNERSDMFEYSGAAMVRFTSRVATVFACILPTLAIGVLTTAHTTLHILLYIGGFTALFSIGLMLLTSPDTTRVEIFTATAAFSAVLVVFVQNQ